MNCKTMLILVVGLLIFTSPAWAQRTTSTSGSGSQQAPPPRVDIIPMYGYVWTVSQSATYNLNSGDFDFKSSDFWGVALDIYKVPVMQVRLLYRRQNTQLTIKQFGVVQDIGDVAVEYWHIGAVKGLEQNNVKPFGALTLGATRYVYDSGDEWKFSLILGLGAKIRLNEKLGIMLSGNMPFTFTNAFLGIGTGGVSV
ncbi:MAG: hypothetical protein IH969_09230, partial [Candidatus Krumholzibacteriota bacterium]|nr:hypothetical protein [Candidatus Krumholzibacteriota bacterium]